MSNIRPETQLSDQILILPGVGELAEPSARSIFWPCGLVLLP